MADFHRQILVFEPVSSAKAIRYVCYENLTTGQFAVSSGEVLTAPQGSAPCRGVGTPILGQGQG